jgi:hypothetical protein
MEHWQTRERGNTLCDQVLLGITFFYFALQCHLLAIPEVSAVAVYNFKAQASLRHVL